MHKNQRGSHVILVTAAVVLVLVVGFAGYRVTHKATTGGSRSGNIPREEDQGPNYKALAACGDGPVLTTLPTKLETIDAITPLGSINPPEHTIPTDHNYFMYKYERPDERYDMVAPADVVVTGLGFSGEVTGGHTKNADYSIIVSPCKGLSFRFSHVNALEGKLKEEIAPDGTGADCNTSKPTTDKQVMNCGKTVDIKLSAGELMGRVGDKYVAAWDFWAHKEGYVNPGITSPEYRYDGDTICGLDYFVDSIKTQLYAKLNRKGEPKCGEVGQDKKDTLQGSWFAHKDPEKARTDWNSHFTLGHDSADAAKGIMAVAGKIATPAKYGFNPRQQGTINREPSQTAAGTVYCYQHDGDKRFDNGSMAGDGKVLLKLLDNHTMQAEHKDGTCLETETQTAPTTYYR